MSKIYINNLLNLRGNFVLIAHRAMQFDSSGKDIILQNKDYKKSAAVDSHQVVVVYMDEQQEFFDDKGEVALNNSSAFGAKMKNTIEHGV